MDGHDKRDSLGVPLAAILALIDAALPGWVARWNGQGAASAGRKKEGYNNMSYSSLSPSPNKPQSEEYASIIEFLKDVSSVDVDRSDIFNIRLFASPEMSEIHENIASILEDIKASSIEKSVEFLENLPEVSQVCKRLRRRFPMLNSSKYGYPTIEELVLATPSHAPYSPFPMSPTLLLDAPVKRISLLPFFCHIYTHPANDVLVRSNLQCVGAHFH